MAYKAVVVRRSDDELMHWKYIKKKKVNGEWRYYYDKSELTKYSKGSTDRLVNNTTKGKVARETQYKQTDDLFDNTSTIKLHSSFGGKSYDDTITIKSQGSLSRSIAKAEKWVFDKVYSKKNNNKKNSSSISSTIDRGKKAVSKFLRGIANSLD